LISGTYFLLSESIGPYEAKQGAKLKPAVEIKPLYPVMFACLLLFTSSSLAAQTTTDSALWAGGLFLFEREKGLDYSVEYQLRLAEHMSSLSSHFLEFQGYHKTTRSLLLYGAYRYTRRPDHDENRIVFGGFWDLTKTKQPLWEYSDRFKAVLQIGYQRDFDVEFDDELIQSNSIRWVLVGSKPATETVTPFFIAGVLTTWNESYSFGVDKVRLGGGISWKLTERSRMRAQYIFERAYFMTPEKKTNIIWLRYEMKLGK
jgi:hypothetical protein